MPASARLSVQGDAVPRRLAGKPVCSCIGKVKRVGHGGFYVTDFIRYGERNCLRCFRFFALGINLIVSFLRKAYLCVPVLVSHNSVQFFIVCCVVKPNARHCVSLQIRYRQKHPLVWCAAGSGCFQPDFRLNIPLADSDRNDIGLCINAFFIAKDFINAVFIESHLQKSVIVGHCGFFRAGCGIVVKASAIHIQKRHVGIIVTCSIIHLCLESQRCARSNFNFLLMPVFCRAQAGW